MVSPTGLQDIHGLSPAAILQAQGLIAVNGSDQQQPQAGPSTTNRTANRAAVNAPRSPESRKRRLDVENPSSDVDVKPRAKIRAGTHNNSSQVRFRRLKFYVY